MTLDSLRRIHVPIIIGTNAGDGVLGTGLTHPEKVSPRLSKDDLAFFRERYASLGITGDAALAPRLYGDILYTAPARWLAENVAAEKRPVYLYRFDYILSALANTRRIAPHGSEIPFVFANYPPIVDDADRSVGAALHGCWAAFARTGTPQCPAAPVWPVYDAANGREMVFGNDPSLRAPDDDDVLRRLEERLRASP
jgi:para-nitrobenzyl esterase